LLAIKLRIAVKSVLKFFVAGVCVGVAAGVTTSYLVVGVGVGVGVGVAAGTGAGAGAEPPVSAAYALGVISDKSRVSTNFCIGKC
jgi:hypothetical protein